MKLPIDQLRTEFDAVLAEAQARPLVLTAPTGSGKSTRVPLWCWQQLKAPILVIEPRRIACRTLAHWVAQGLNQSVGQTVGFSVRFEQKLSEQTEILFVTPGVARRYLVEGEIDRFALVVFDEFHERSWETDALLAVLAAREVRPRLLIMSATLAADQLVKTYGAARLDSQGRKFPVELSYAASTDQELTVPSGRGLVERVCRAVKDAWQSQGEGSILVFLPGLASMRDCEQRLRGLPVHLLHGTFSHQEQDKAFSEERRIILATNVAESSLTVPGVTTVVDSGLERRPIHQSGYVALATVPIAKSSADQRAGRAGRTAPGRAIRLWDERARLEAVKPADIERMELDDLVLFMAALPEGLSTPTHWVQEPPNFAWDRARQRLVEAGLVKGDRISELGQGVLRLPVEHDWGRLLVSAPAELRADLCDLCALASARRNPLKSSSSQDVETARKEDLGEHLWQRALAIVRVGEPAKHALHAEALSNCRQVARELRALVQATDPDRTRPHQELQNFMAREWPQRHFVRRANRQAWGNGSVECRTPRGEDLPEDCQAAVFLDVQPVLGRGLKVELQGRWGLPSRFSILREAGLGEPELTRIRWKDGVLTARVDWTYAGRVLGSEEDQLSGHPLRRALTQLFIEGRWKSEVKSQVERQFFYAVLAAALEGEVQEFELGEYLQSRLKELGVETCEELSLIEDEDLESSLLPEYRIEELEKSYPMAYVYGGSHYTLEYQPRKKKVLMHWRSGPKGSRPKPQHLPRWNGWRVEVNEKGRQTVLRP